MTDFRAMGAVASGWRAVGSGKWEVKVGSGQEEAGITEYVVDRFS